jgi:hypothetical protein
MTVPVIPTMLHAIRTHGSQHNDLSTLLPSFPF